MATHHHSDGFYLMNPRYTGYADSMPNFYNFAATVALSPLPPAEQLLDLPISYEETHNSNIHWNDGLNMSQSLSLSLKPNEKSLVNENQVHSYKHASYPSPLDLVSSVSNGMQNMMTGSKYLKAAKHLLEEIASMAKETKEISMDSQDGTSSRGGDICGKGEQVELATAQRQEIQVKKAKLHIMLDEVDQRYNQYHHQMQSIAASFEEASGVGSAESYTSLALNTISKHFWWLKYSITSQIRALNKSLGEEESIKGTNSEKPEGSSRQNRIQKQQLGMIQTNTWRPHRGLPERAVSVLRAWLFEHFLHPYPKDLDKQLLAKQTGLTRSQVSNWFINARVRHWKPMVEEMYLEEIKINEPNVKTGQSRSYTNTLTSKQDKNKAKTFDHLNLQVLPSTEISSVISTSSSTAPIAFSYFNITSDQKNPKKPRNHDDQTCHTHAPNRCIFLPNDVKDSRTNKGRFVAPSCYGSELGLLSFMGNNSINNVSLTLALPPSQSNSQQHFSLFQDTGFELSTTTDQANGGVLQSSNNVDYGEIIDFHNRKILLSHILPDFVA